MSKTVGYLVLAVAALLAVVLIGTVVSQRERVIAYNVSSPTTCISGIVYFVDKGSKQVITPVIDDKTDKPQHCK